MAIIICSKFIEVGLNFITQSQTNSKAFTMEIENEKQTIATKRQKIIINEKFEDQQPKSFIVIDSSLLNRCQLVDIRKAVYGLFEQENYEFLDCLILIQINNEKEIVDKMSLALQIELKQWLQLQYRSKERDFQIQLQNSDTIPYPQSPSIFGQFKKIPLKQNITLYNEDMKREMAKNVKIYLLVGPSKVGKSTFINQIFGIKTPSDDKNSYYKTNIQNQECVFIDTKGYQREWEVDLRFMKDIYNYTLQIVDNLKAQLDGILIFESISNDSLNIIYTFKLLQQIFNATTLADSCMIVGTKGNIIPENFRTSRMDSIKEQRLKLFGKDIPLIDCQLSHYSFGEFVAIPKLEQTKQEFYDCLPELVPAVLQNKEKMLYIICGNHSVGKSSFLNYLANKDMIILLQNQIGTLFRLISNSMDNTRDYYFLETTGSISKKDNASALKYCSLSKFILQTMIFLEKQQIDGFLFIDSLGVTKISVIEIIIKFQQEFFKDVQNSEQHMIAIALANFSKPQGNAGKFQFFKSYIQKKIPTKTINTIMFQNDKANINELNEQLDLLKPLPKSVIQIIVDSEEVTQDIDKTKLPQQLVEVNRKQDKPQQEQYVKCIIEHEMDILDEKLQIMLQNYVLQQKDYQLSNTTQSKDIFILSTQINSKDAINDFHYDHFNGLISFKFQVGESFPAEFNIQQQQIKSFKTMKKIIPLFRSQDTTQENQIQLKQETKLNYIMRYMNWQLNLRREEQKKQLILYNILPGNEEDCDQQIRKQITKFELLQISNKIQAQSLNNELLEALIQRAKQICYLDCYVVIDDLETVKDNYAIIALKNVPNLFVFFTTYNLDQVNIKDRQNMDQLIHIVNPSFEQRTQIIKNYQFPDKTNEYLQLLSFNFSSNSLNSLLIQLKAIKEVERSELCKLAIKISRKDDIKQLENMSCIADQLIQEETTILPLQYFQEQNITEVIVFINNENEKKITSVMYYENLCEKSNEYEKQLSECSNQSKSVKKEQKLETKSIQTLKKNQFETPLNIPKLINIQYSTVEDLKQQLLHYQNNITIQNTQMDIELQKQNSQNQRFQLHEQLIDLKYNHPAPISDSQFSLLDKDYESLIEQNKLNITLMYEQYSQNLGINQDSDSRYMFVNYQKNTLEYGQQNVSTLNLTGFPYIDLVRIAVKLKVDQIIKIDTLEASCKLYNDLEKYPVALIIVNLDQVQQFDQVIHEIQFATKIYRDCRVAYGSREQMKLEQAKLISQKQ